MVRPTQFGFNPETSATNPYQQLPDTMDNNAQEVTANAIHEFDSMVEILRGKDIDVLLLPPREGVITPDAVFPNNWFSHHADGKLIIYPMLAKNRRLERQTDRLRSLLFTAGVPVSEVIDLSEDEQKGLFLESTGSMVLDRVHNVAFSFESARTVAKEFKKWCNMMSYEGILLHSANYEKNEVYHTNFLMSIGTEFAVFCPDVLRDAKEKDTVRARVESLGKELIEISIDQVYGYCGNILEIQSRKGKRYILLSATAHKSFTPRQLERLQTYAELLICDIPTIERIGGGGVRCMVAEVFV